MRKMRFRRYLLGITAVLAAAVIISALSFDKIIVFLFSRTYNMDVRYCHLRAEGFKKLEFEGLVLSDKKTGIGFSAEKATVEGIPLAFDLRDVRFLKTAPAREAYGDISGLVATPFASSWKYDRISGIVRVIKKNFLIRDFRAQSAEIKLSFTGEISRDNKIDGDLAVYFAGKVLSKIPEELTNLILTDEKDGWKKLSVNLKGDYRSPSVKISSKLFRLKINTVKNAN